MRGQIDHVEMERRRVVGEVDEVARPGVVARIAVEEVDQRHRGDDPRAALPARRHGRVFEGGRGREQRIRLAGVEVDPLTVLVEYPQGDSHDRGHQRKVAVP